MSQARYLLGSHTWQRELGPWLSLSHHKYVRISVGPSRRRATRVCAFWALAMQACVVAGFGESPGSRAAAAGAPNLACVPQPFRRNSSSRLEILNRSAGTHIADSLRSRAHTVHLHLASPASLARLASSACPACRCILAALAGHSQHTQPLTVISVHALAPQPVCPLAQQPAVVPLVRTDQIPALVAKSAPSTDSPATTMICCTQLHCLLAFYMHS